MTELPEEAPETPDVDPYDPDTISRIIMLIYGTMETGSPFWCYVAVKPSVFDAFKAAETDGTLDLYNFDAFGEIIVSAEGETPPDEVTLKVAEIYGADPSTFFQPVDPKQVIHDRIAQLKAQNEQ